MFHGPRLQGCTRIDGHSSEGMVAELTTLPTHDYFAGIATPRLQFDAALLDAAGQLAGFWLRERNTGVPNCFPFRVRSVKLYAPPRSEEHTSELQSLMRISYAVFCLTKKIHNRYHEYNIVILFT